MPAIPAFWRLKRKDSLDFKVTLNYRVRPCLKTNEPEHSFNVLIACPCLFQYNAPEEDQPVLRKPYYKAVFLKQAHSDHPPAPSFGNSKYINCGHFLYGS